MYKLLKEKDSIRSTNEYSNCVYIMPFIITKICTSITKLKKLEVVQWVMIVDKMTTNNEY